jgi:hypothetical protein
MPGGRNKDHHRGTEKEAQGELSSPGEDPAIHGEAAADGAMDSRVKPANDSVLQLLLCLCGDLPSRRLARKERMAAGATFIL